MAAGRWWSRLRRLTLNKMAAELQRGEMLHNNLMANILYELRTPPAELEGNLRSALDHVYALDEAKIANLYGQACHLTRLSTICASWRRSRTASCPWSASRPT